MFFKTIIKKSVGKQSKLLASLLLGVLSISASATQLTISDNLMVKAMDGKKVETSFFDKNTKIDLSAGEHLLILKYEDIFENLEISFDTYETIKSDNFIVKFTVADQNRLKLSTPKIKNLAAAQAFIKAPKVILVDENNAALPLSYKSFARYQAAEKLAQLKALTSEPVVAMAASAPQVPIKPSLTMKQPMTVKPELSVKAMSPISPVKSTTLIPTSETPHPLTMLKYWWNNASAEEKAAFTLYLKQVNH